MLVPYAQVARARLRGAPGRHAAVGDRDRAQRRGRRSPTCSSCCRTCPIEFTDRGGFETSDEEYAGIVRQIIDDEIGQGEGANLVIGRHYRAQVADWGHDAALTVFRRLLERERGAFWTF